MSKKHKIVILSGDTNTQELTLSNKHIWTEKKDTVEWSIDKKSNVSKVTLIYKKDDSPEIFSHPPYQEGEKWRGYIDLKPHFITTYKYSITWEDTTGNGPYVYDPKISVFPNILPFVNKIVGLIAACIVGFFTFKFLRKKKWF